MTAPCNVTTVHDAYTMLKDFGLPIAVLTWAVLSHLRQSRKRLSIRQVGCSVTDTVTQQDGRTLFQFEVVLTNDSPHATIVIAYYDLKFPWNDPDFEPLLDPMENAPPSNVYSIYGRSIHFDREYVINHRRYQFGKLAPGDAIRGFFLAKGLQPIPSDLLSVKKELRCIEAPFIVEDTAGKQYKSKRPIELYY